jgi:hypothetical protein
VAECAFGVTTRALAAEGGPSEQAMATFPMRRFVLAGGLTVITDGLLEYELTDLAGPSGADGVVDPCDPHSAANALALTVVRCTGRVSQGPMMTRPLPAGPTLRTRASPLLVRRRRERRRRACLRPGRRGAHADGARARARRR